MIIIHGSLALGGVETFIVRLAKQRSREGKLTSILLLSPEKKSDSGLIREAKKFASVYSFNEIFDIPSFVSDMMPFHLSLLFPLKIELFNELKSFRHVHATCGFSALFYIRIFRLLNVESYLTVGVYQSSEFIWGGQAVPYFERLNREVFFEKLPKGNCLFFNDSVHSLYQNLMSVDLSGCRVFPLGVIADDLLNEQEKRRSSEVLRIVSVGRLVPFKTYNIHALEIVKQLNINGYNIIYHVYGDGPLLGEMERFIIENELDDIVYLKGALPYDDFNDVISQYDLFIGSGTAIVQASSLGVCSLIGIENNQEQTTYGFFSDVEGFSYNEDGMGDKKPIIDFIEKYIGMTTSEKIELSGLHISKASNFSMKSCSISFDSVEQEKLDKLCVSYYSSFFIRLKYSLSFFCTSIVHKLKSSSLSDRVRKG